MYYRLTFLILFIFLNNFGFSQSDSLPQKRMIYGIGYSHLRVLDQQNSPLIYRGNLLDATIGYEKMKPGKSLFNSSLNINGGVSNSKSVDRRKVENHYFDNNGTLQQKFVRLVYTTFQANLTAEYLLNVKGLSSKNLNLYVGGQLREYFFMHYMATWGFDMPSVLNEFSVNPKVLLNYKLHNDIELNTSLSFPLFGLITRLPYSNVPNSDKYSPFVSTFAYYTQFASIDQNQRFDFKFGIEKPLNEKWNFLLNYQFLWYHFTEAKPIKAYSNSIQFQFVRKLNIKN
jgi:hypothetical protein